MGTARPGVLSSIKNWLKKGSDKVGKFVEKTAKTIRKYQPLIDKVTDFIPGGEEIDKYLNVGLDIAEKTGEGLQEIGKGKNVIKTAAQKAMEYLNMTSENQKPNENKPSSRSQKQDNSQPSFLSNKLN